MFRFITLGWHAGKQTWAPRANASSFPHKCRWLCVSRQPTRGPRSVSIHGPLERVSSTCLSERYNKRGAGFAGECGEGIAHVYFTCREASWIFGLAWILGCLLSVLPSHHHPDHFPILCQTRQSRADLDRRDGATLLKEKQLFSLFPAIDKHFLLDIFRDHKYI